MTEQRRAAPDPAPDRARPRRVLMASYLFPPAMEIGAQACSQIARHLPRYGWEPVVLTVQQRYFEHIDAGAPVFPGAVIRTAVLPHPCVVYARLKATLRRRAAGGTGQQAALARTGVLRRWLLSLLLLPDVYTGWIPLAVIAGLGAIRRHRVEHLFSSGPPWAGQLVGLALARLSGLPWTVHFRDPWVGPRSEMQRLKPVSACSAQVEAALERMVVRRADAIVCVTDEHAALLRRTYPEVPADRFVTIPNGFDGSEWEGLGIDGGEVSPTKDTFVIAYAGSLYDRRDPQPVFRALRALIDAGEVVREHVRVELIGWCDSAGGRRVTDVAAEWGLDGCIHLTGPLSRAETLRRTARADLLLLLAEGLSLQIPGKTYEYLRAARPILALAPEGAVARLLRRTGGAWVVDPASEAGLVTAVREAYRRWQAGQDGPAADPAVVASFDRRLLAGRFVDLFERRLRADAAHSIGRRSGSSTAVAPPAGRSRG